MSPHVACAPQGASLFPELPSNPSWFADESVGTSDDRDNPFELSSTAGSLDDAELLRLARDFVERSAALIDAVAPPAWEDPDDIFGGEVFDDERAEYQRLSAINPTSERKAAAARELMINEAARYPGCTVGFLIALALTYRRILMDRTSDPQDKVEIVRRVYSTHEPEWMTAEIVYLHFVLLDQCRYLARPSASIERKEETLRWIFTDLELEDRPFSFKNCVKLVTGNVPDFGAVYRRLQDEMRPALVAWLHESLVHKRGANDRQSELFDL
jgi:hypothetical protein